MSTKLLLLCFTLSIALEFADAVELCNQPYGGVGKCVPVRECPILATLPKSALRDEKIVKYLISLKCGPQNETKVCCSDCFTPEGKLGTCNHIAECPNMMNVVYSNPNYVRDSMCITGGYDVCCGPVPAEPIRGECASRLTAFPPNPATGCCGIDASGKSKIFGGSSTEIDQYPWLVLLEYNNTKNNRKSLLCGGSLISNKYVLTAAHCAPDNKQPISVRLGEYDIANDKPDCVSAPAYGQDCADPPISLPIKKIIKHPEYNATLNRNDIALIKLDGVVNFTDFIRPICLPTSDISELNSTGMKLSVAGWGKISWDIQHSRLKQHVQLPMVDMQDCQNRYYSSKLNPKPLLWSRQLCAGGEQGRDTCNGDSGGPLMLEATRADGSQFYTLEGIVSYGPKQCGTEGIPGVYTKVFEYNTWIRRTIRP